MGEMVYLLLLGVTKGEMVYLLLKGVKMGGGVSHFRLSASTNILRIFKSQFPYTPLHYRYATTGHVRSFQLSDTK